MRKLLFILSIVILSSCGNNEHEPDVAYLKLQTEILEKAIKYKLADLERTNEYRYGMSDEYKTALYLDELAYELIDIYEKYNDELEEDYKFAFREYVRVLNNVNEQAYSGKNYPSITKKYFHKEDKQIFKQQVLLYTYIAISHLH